MIKIRYSILAINQFSCCRESVCVQFAIHNTIHHNMNKINEFHSMNQTHSEYQQFVIWFICIILYYISLYVGWNKLHRMLKLLTVALTSPSCLYLTIISQKTDHCLYFYQKLPYYIYAHLHEGKLFSTQLCWTCPH